MDKGTISLILGSHRIEIISTPLIFNYFIHRYSCLLNLPKVIFRKIIKFKPVFIGVPLILNGIIVKFSYDLGPQINLEMNFNNEFISYRGQSLEGLQFENLSKSKSITKERIN